jgi:NitT/TauT family transport system substrate-binding protein
MTGFGLVAREGAPFVGIAKGYFADAGLRVSVLPGQAGDANVQQLLAGHADVAVLDFSKLMTVLAAMAVHGDPDRPPFKVIAVVQQLTIIAIMALRGHGISTFADLPGKTLQQAYGTIGKILLPSIGKLAGFDADKVRWEVDTKPEQLVPDLVAGRVQGIVQFVPAAPTVQAAAHGVPVVVLPYSDEFGDLPGNVLVARTDLIEGDPGLIRRFVGAYLHSLAYAVTNPTESGKIIQKAAPAAVSSPDIAAAELTRMAPYVQVGPKLGRLDRARAARAIALLESVLVIPGGLLRPDQFLATPFDATPTP